MKIFFLLLTLLFGLIACSETSSTNFIDSLKSEYNKNNTTSKFLISYTQKYFNPYQSYDYRIKDTLSQKFTIWIDYENNRLFDEIKSNFPGGYIFEVGDLKKDTTTIRYDKNGILWGKRIQKLDNWFSTIDNLLFEIIDSRYIEKLLQIQNLDKNSTVNVNQSQETATIQTVFENKDTVIFSFDTNPIKLKSFSNLTKNKKLTFTHYKKSNGLNYASQIKNFVKGELKSIYNIETFEPLDSIPLNRLQLPDGYDRFINKPEKLNLEKIDKNLFLVSNVAGDRNVLFKINNNQITVFGAPINEKINEEIIQLINERFPSKKITGLYITHAHSDHIGGITAYTNLDIPVITDQYSAEAIAAFPKFNSISNSFKFKIIENDDFIDGVKYYLPENSHSHGQSFAYFPDSKIIYQGDYLEIPFDNTIPSLLPETTKEFVEFVKLHKLEINRIVGHHRNNNISPDLMYEYYKQHN